MIINHAVIDCLYWRKSSSMTISYAPASSCIAPSTGTLTQLCPHIQESVRIRISIVSYHNPTSLHILTERPFCKPPLRSDKVRIRRPPVGAWDVAEALPNSTSCLFR
jgi:hypothetical protein